MAITKTEKRMCCSEQRLKRVSAGKCPHCKLLFSNPVTLTCGHSLCALCCQELLDRRSNLDSTINGKTLTEQTPQATPMRTPMMGTRVLSEFTPTKISPNGRTPARPPKRFSLTIRAPECPNCQHPASYHPPIKNLALAQLIRVVSKRKRNSNLATYRNPLYSLPEKHETTARPSSSSSGFESEQSVENVCISKLNIAILGSNGVGKSQLTRTQYLNNLFFGQIDSAKVEANTDELGAELFAKYLINIIDQSDQKDFVQSVTDAHGFVFLYSITDKNSFDQLAQIIQDVKMTRKDKTSFIVIGTKSDLKDKREVSSFEGQQLARQHNCAFFEVSAKENDCVNEVFNQLVQIIDNKHGL